MSKRLKTSVKSVKTIKSYVAIISVALIGSLLILISSATTPYAQKELELTTLSNGAIAITDTNASGGSAVVFNPQQVSNKTYKIMPLGDSITNGNYIDTYNGYRLHLWNNLKAEGINIDYVGYWSKGDSSLLDKDLSALGGWCIQSAKPSCYGYPLYPYTVDWITQYQPDIVIMEGGTNDLKFQTVETVKQSMRDWVELIFQTKPDVKIILVGAPNLQPVYEQWTPTFVAEQQALGKQIKYMKYYGVVDLKDGTHPSPQGYITFANELTPLVKSFIK